VSTNATALEMLEEAFRLIGAELVYSIPRIVIASLAIATIIVVGIVLSRIVSRILTVAKIDELVRPYVEKYGIPFTPRSVINVLIIVGLALLALYSTVAIAAPQYMEVATSATDYIARVVSVAVMLIIIVSTLSIVFDKIRLERGVKGFTFLITMMLALAVLVDITNLSPEVKNSIVWGLSLGIGLSIGVFTAWYFFEEVIKGSAKQSGKNAEPEKPVSQISDSAVRRFACTCRLA